MTEIRHSKTSHLAQPVIQTNLTHYFKYFKNNKLASPSQNKKTCLPFARKILSEKSAVGEEIFTGTTIAFYPYAVNIKNCLFFACFLEMLRALSYKAMCFI
jgi:hypothetical protein